MEGLVGVVKGGFWHAPGRRGDPDPGRGRSTAPDPPAGRRHLLATFPGLLALVLYYRALGHTPASRATLAELAFPLTAVVVGVSALGASPTASQWAGFAVVLAAVVGLALHE